MSEVRYKNSIDRSYRGGSSRLNRYLEGNSQQCLKIGEHPATGGQIRVIKLWKQLNLLVHIRPVQLPRHIVVSFTAGRLTYKQINNPSAFLFVGTK